MFGRRAKASPAYYDPSASPAGSGALPTLTPPVKPPTGPGGLTAGWKPGPGIPNPQQQIGAYDGGMLNQFPAYLPGPQLHSVREFGNSGWYYPSLTPLPNGNLTQTTTPNNVPGAQRYGSLFSGPIGPISAKKNAARLAAQQVRQSGLAATTWGLTLNPAYAMQPTSP